MGVGGKLRVKASPGCLGGENKKADPYPGAKGPETLLGKDTEDKEVKDLQAIFARHLHASHVMSRVPPRESPPGPILSLLLLGAAWWVRSRLRPLHHSPVCLRG